LPAPTSVSDKIAKALISEASDLAAQLLKLRVLSKRAVVPLPARSGPAHASGGGALA
jgi:hypothetical protein